MQRAKTVIPTGKERDVQEMFEYSLHPQKRFFFLLRHDPVVN